MLWSSAQSIPRGIDNKLYCRLIMHHLYVFVCMCGLVFMCVVFAQEPKENLLGLTLKFHKLLIDCKVGQFPHTNSNIYRRTSFDDVARVRPRNSPVCTRTARRSGRCGELSLLITPLVISRTCCYSHRRTRTFLFTPEEMAEGHRRWDDGMCVRVCVCVEVGGVEWGGFAL